MDALSRLVYAIALAWFTAYFEAQAASQIYQKESHDAEDLAKLQRMRDALRKLREARSGNPGSNDSTPTG